MLKVLGERMAVWTKHKCSSQGTSIQPLVLLNLVSEQEQVS